MRRALLPLLAVLATTSACGPLDASLQRRGAVHLASRGVAVFADGHHAHAAMLGSTCELDTVGGIGDDRSVTGRGAPDLLDGRTTDDADVVLVRTRDTIGVMEATFGRFGRTAMQMAASADWAADGPAALVDGGVVALDGCRVAWLDEALDLRSAATLDSPACDDARLAVDRDARVAWVAADGAVHRVDASGATPLDLLADDLAFSSASGDLLLVDAAAQTVRAVDADGVERWALTTAEPILQIADFPNSPYALVVTGSGLEDDDTGRLLFVDAATGALDREATLPRAAEVRPSEDGRTFALVRPRMTQFFRLR